MKIFNTLFLLFSFVLSATLFVSCGDDEPELNDDELLQEFFAANNITPQQTASGLYYVIEEPGIDTLMPTRSSTVTVHYRGYFLNGDIFDSSYLRGEPTRFSLRAVIPGWTEGIPLFGVGGRGSLYLPSNLGYGPEGSLGGVIPPNTPIAFDIELFDFE